MMKITVIGGGGVRAPLFVASALRRASMIHPDEICLMDIRPEKLEIMAAISRQVGVMMDSPVRISLPPTRSRLSMGRLTL